MIWIRRILAVILAILVVVLFIAFAFVGRVNSTVGNPDFYIQQLREGDVYNFIYDTAMPAALKDMDTEMDLGGGIVLNTTRLKSKMVSTVKQILPPDWIQARVEDALNEVLPYMVGDADSFSLTIPLKDRVTVAGKAAKDVVHDDVIFDDVYNALVDKATDEFQKSFQENTPFKLNLTRDEVRNALMTLVSKDWLRAQIDGAIDAAIPYITGDAEHFTVRIEIKSRVDAAVKVAKDILGKSETYNYLFDEMIAPMVTENIGSAIQFPYGITVTKAEVIDAAKQVLPQEWLKERLYQVLDAASAYIKSETGSLEISVSLVDRKAAALKVVQDLAERKIEGVFNSMRTCTVAETSELILSLPPFGVLPKCKPATLTYSEVKKLLGIDLGPTVSQLVGLPIPDSFKFTQKDLEDLMGAENKKALDDARKYVSQGWTYTDADMRADMGSEDLAKLDRGREWVRKGFTLTDEDLKKLADTGDIGVLYPEFGDGKGGNGSDVKLDEIRGWLGILHKWWGLASWAVLVLLCVAIGFLGGRNWFSRTAWAAVPLMVGSAITYVVTGPVFSIIVRPEVHNAIVDAIDVGKDEVARVMADRFISVGERLVDSFMSGIANQSLLVFVLTIIIFIGVLVAPTILRRNSRNKEPDRVQTQ